MTKETYRLNKLLLYSIILAACIVLGNLGIVLFATDEQQKLVLIDVTYPLWDLWAVIGLAYAATRSVVYARRLALAWGTMALASLSEGIGNSIWAILELGQGSVPFPSLADAAYLSLYPLFLYGVLLIPARRSQLSEQLKLLLDMLIVMLSAALVFWCYVLGPAAASATEESLLEWVVALSYPVGDLVLFWAVLVILYHKVDMQRSGPLLLLAFATGISIAADSLYSIQAILGTYESAGLLDISWIVKNLLYGIAGVWQAVAGPPDTLPDSSTAVSARLRTWLIYLPYACAISAYLILEYNHRRGEHLGSTWLTWGVGLIIVLVLLRQMMTLRENHRQSQMLSQINQDLHMEISERKRVEEQLAYDSLYDALTGLPNRVLFLDRLRHAMEFAQRHAEFHFSVLFLDLDHFKVINDSLGHIVGDQLLSSFAQRLRICLNLSETVARLGGDEFILLSRPINRVEMEQLLAHSQHTSAMSQPFGWAGRSLVKPATAASA